MHQSEPVNQIFTDNDCRCVSVYRIHSFVFLFHVAVSLATVRCINPQTYKQTYTPIVILGGG